MFALKRMVTVIIISCPHALGLAVPLVAAISTSISARKGLLIRNRTAFENARLISTIIFDKTGTLTQCSHELEKVEVQENNFSEEELLRLAAAVEQHSEHYIAAGILRAAKKKNITIPKVNQFKYLPGMGLEGIVEDQEIKVVGPNYLEEHKIEPISEAEEDNGTVVYI